MINTAEKFNNFEYTFKQETIFPSTFNNDKKSNFKYILINKLIYPGNFEETNNLKMFLFQDLQQLKLQKALLKRKKHQKFQLRNKMIFGWLTSCQLSKYISLK